jgi:hypothetical protein
MKMTKKGQAKVGKVMGEYKDKELHSGKGGKVVKSRGGQPATTQNFVVFPGNEDLLTIIKRNGGLLD